MNEYTIFWVIDEIADHYFHKSDYLYRFFKDFQNNKERNDLKIQYDYMTNNFPEETLISHMERYNENGSMLQIKGPQVEIYKKTQYIALHISKKHLKFCCETLQDAEELLFPVLRQFQLSLFIIGENTHNYGWISPILASSKYQSEQVLYSYH